MATTSERIRTASLLRSMGITPGPRNKSTGTSLSLQQAGKVFDERSGLALLPELLKDEKAAKNFGLDKSDYKDAVYQHDDMLSDTYISDRAKNALKDYKMVTRGFAGMKDGRIHQLVGADGKVAWQSSPFQKTGFADDLKEGIQFMAPMALGFALPGLGGALGAKLGLTGATAQVIGNSILNTGMAALGGAKGGNLLKAAVAGGLGGGISSYGASAGWNPALTAAVKPIVTGAVTGASPEQMLLGAFTGGIGSQMSPQAAQFLKAFVNIAQRGGK